MNRVPTLKVPAPSWVLYLLVSLLFCACQRPQTDRPVSAPKAAGGGKGGAAAGQAREAVTTYRIFGVVKEVDRPAGEVRIKHDAIPGYMPAMTMPFTVDDKESLEDLRPGDEVEGSLRVSSSRSELTDLRVTRPAVGNALSLNLSGGTASLKPKPEPLRPGQPVPDFGVTTQDGKPLRLNDLRGKVIVLTFIYTRCPLPDFCPLMDRKFAALADRLQAVPGRAEGVRLLSVSFDPEHDTPEVLTQHARRQGAKPPLWTFAVASHDELAKVAAPLGLAYGPTENEIAHNLVTAVVGPDGRLVRLEKGRQWEPTDLFKTIYPLLDSTRQ